MCTFVTLSCLFNLQNYKSDVVVWLLCILFISLTTTDKMYLFLPQFHAISVKFLGALCICRQRWNAFNKK